MRTETLAKTLASVLAATATCVVSAATWTDGGGRAWTYSVQSDGTAALGTEDGYNAIAYDTAGELVLPSSVDGLRVTAVGKYAFSGCRSLTGVTIPDSVVRIGYGAFHQCTALARVSLPDSVTDIGEIAFSECYSLTNREGFVILKDILFGYYGQAEELTLPSNIKHMSDYSLYNRYRLTHVTVPAGVTNIGNHAFKSCKALKSVSLPRSVTRIGEYAFSYCESLESLTLPSQMTEIADAMCLSCLELKKVNMPKNIKRIGESAFSSCYSLAAFDIPFGVTNIDNSAFCCCKSLESIKIPSTVSRIGKCAFDRCEILYHVRFMGDAPVMGRSIFTCIHSEAQVTVPTELPGWADVGDTWNDMTVIPAKANGGPYQETVNGIAWSFTVAEGTATVESGRFGAPAISSATVGAVTVPSSLGQCEVATIGPWAFRYCDKITAVSMPDTVLSIGESGFEGCASLKRISLPPSMLAVGDFAFYNCQSLQRVVFEGDVLKLGSYSFCGCVELASITFNGAAPEVQTTSFASCPSGGKVIIPSDEAGWAAPGNKWNGMTLYHLTEDDENTTYINALPEYTVFRPEKEIKIMPVLRMQYTDEEMAEMAAQVSYLPADIDQETRFFKAKAKVNSEGHVVIAAELDLDAMAFAETSKAVADQMAAAPAGTVTLKLPSAKPGFWYGVTATDDLAELNKATTADVADRAMSDGVTLSLSKPAGTAAFFKVTVSSEAISMK